MVYLLETKKKSNHSSIGLTVAVDVLLGGGGLGAVVIVVGRWTELGRVWLRLLAIALAGLLLAESRRRLLVEAGLAHYLMALLVH